MNTFTGIRIIALSAAVVLLLAQMLLKAWPSAAEAYLSGVYPYLIRTLLGFFTWMPFPVVYISLLVLMFFLFNGIRLAVKGAAHPMAATGRLALHIATVLFVLAGIFSVLWGYNYTAGGIEERLNLPETEPDIAVLKAEFLHSVELAQRYRYRMDTSLIDAVPDFWQLHQELQQEMKIQLPLAGYPVLRNLPVKPLYPKGLMLRLSAAGFYCPWAGEGYIDPALHPLQVPFTMAHEMAHVAGITDEGEANLMAWLVCRSHPQYFVRYSGELAYLRYLLRNFRQYDREVHSEVVASLPDEIRGDIQAIYERMQQYPDFFPRSREIVYERYLRVQGIEEGLESYHRMVELVIRWKLLHQSELP